jgi:type IV pilus assembly protein PilA
MFKKQILLTTYFPYDITRIMNKTKRSISKGFTLIELVVVIGILAVLLAIVLIAINPGRQFKQANDTKRRNDVNAILNSIGQYAADHKGDLPTGIPTGTVADALNISDGGADICDDISPTYISALPVDPSTGDEAVTDCASYDTGYQVFQDSDGRVTVLAPDTELASPDISVMR